MEIYHWVGLHLEPGQTASTTGPVNVLLKAHLIRDGRVNETATVWDSTGAVVVQSRQLSGIRFS